MLSGGTKFQCDSSPENHLSGFLAPNDGSHPVIQNSRVGLGRHHRPEPGGGSQEGPGWQEMVVGTGLQSRPGPAEGIPCPHHDSLLPLSTPQCPVHRPGQGGPQHPIKPRAPCGATSSLPGVPTLLQTSRNVCSQLLMPCQLHLGTVPCSVPTCPLTLLPQSFCIPFTVGDSCLLVARGPLEAH